MTKHKFDTYRVIAYSHSGQIHDIIEVPRDARRGWKKRDVKKYIYNRRTIAKVRVEKVQSRNMRYTDHH